MKFSDTYHYTNEHLWVNQSPTGEWLAGITDYAQDLLGDIVFIQPPAVGDVIKNSVACGVVESVKTGSDLHAPMNGVVTEINEALLHAPEGINEKPYSAWIFKFKPLDDTDISHFLTEVAYAELVNQ